MALSTRQLMSGRRQAAQFLHRAALYLEKLPPEVSPNDIDVDAFVRLWRNLPERPEYRKPYEALFDLADETIDAEDAMGSQVGILPVKWASQADSRFGGETGSRMCNSSTQWMIGTYFGMNVATDDDYLLIVERYGDTTDHSAQTKALASLGIQSKWHTTMTFAQLDQSLADKRPVAIGILHKGPITDPHGGHIVAVIGKIVEKGVEKYVLNDPWGDMKDGYTSAPSKGERCKVTKAELEARWQCEGPGSGWGRTYYGNPLPESTAAPVLQVQVMSKETEAKGVEEAAQVIMRLEGLELEAYADPASDGEPWTIGFGSTRYKDGTLVRPGDIISGKEEAMQLLRYQLQKEYLPGQAMIPGWNDFNEWQRAALLSFAWNLCDDRFYGVHGFSTISTVLQERKYDQVPKALMLYHKPMNVAVGLGRRRLLEGFLFSGKYTNVDDAVKAAIAAIDSVSDLQKYL